MAFNLNIRILMYVLVVVVIINFSQLLISTKKIPKYNSRHDIFGNLNVLEDEERIQITTADVNSNFGKRLLQRIDQGSKSDEENSLSENEDLKLDICPKIPADLGYESNIKDLVKTMYIEKLKDGGCKPKDCIARQKIAVIVPLKKYDQILENEYFLKRLHYFLIKQQAEYQIFLVQPGITSVASNVGILLNVAFATVSKNNSWDCIIFHDPHLVPMDSRNLYRCNWYPRQLTPSTFFDPIYQPSCGVITIAPEIFLKLNGFTDLEKFYEQPTFLLDFELRLNKANYTLDRNTESIAQYEKLDLKHDNNEILESTCDTGLEQSVDMLIMKNLTTIKPNDTGTIHYNKLYNLVTIDSSFKNETMY